MNSLFLAVPRLKIRDCSFIIFYYYTFYPWLGGEEMNSCLSQEHFLKIQTALFRIWWTWLTKCIVKYFLSCREINCTKLFCFFNKILSSFSFILFLLILSPCHSQKRITTLKTRNICLGLKDYKSLLRLIWWVIFWSLKEKKSLEFIYFGMKKENSLICLTIGQLYQKANDLILLSKMNLH